MDEIAEGTRVTVDGDAGTVVSHRNKDVRDGLITVVQLDDGSLVLPATEDVEEA